MNLTRPLFIFDLETTGLDPANDRIVQIAFTKLMEDGSKTSKVRLVNPMRPIPEAATAVHRITDEMVAGEPVFGQISKSLHALMEGCDIGGYNIAGFDIEILWEEFYAAGIDWDVSQHRIVDGLAIWRQMKPRKLEDAVLEFCHDAELAPLSLHDAAVDVDYTVQVLEAQLETFDLTIDHAHGMSKRTIDINGEEMERVDLAGALARNAAGVVVLTHKKVRGRPAIEERKYCGWMLHNDGFSENTKIHIRQALGLV